MQIVTSQGPDYFADIQHLVEDNWRESGIPVPFNWDDAVATYTQLAECGLLFTAVAYEGERAVGYAMVIKTPHMLNHSVLTVNISGFYVEPKYRNGTLAARIMSLVRRHARHAGGHHILWHAPAGSSFERALDARFDKINSYFMEAL